MEDALRGFAPGPGHTRGEHEPQPRHRARALDLDVHRAQRRTPPRPEPGPPDRPNGARMLPGLHLVCRALGSVVSAISRAPEADALSQRYRAVRAASLALAEPLSAEDCALQSMPDASPTKWHLAHTSWYFETFALEPGLPGYRSFEPEFRVLFNSYYNGVGPQYARPQRGLLTRPSLAEVLAYREHVDRHVLALLADARARRRAARDRVARHASRAAAPGADPHRSQAPVRAESARARVPRVGRARGAGRRRRRRALRRVPGRRARGRPRGPRLRVRQRGPAPPRLSRAVRAREPPRHEPRLSRVHRRGRLPRPRRLAVRRLGRRAAPRLGGAALLAAARRRVVDLHARRRARARARRARRRT